MCAFLIACMLTSVPIVLFCGITFFSSFFRLLMGVTLFGDIHTLVYCDYFRITCYSFVPLSFSFGIVLGLRPNVRTV